MDFWKLLAHQSRQICELQVQWETGSQKRRLSATEGDSWCCPGCHTCMHTSLCSHMCTHTDTCTHPWLYPQRHQLFKPCIGEGLAFDECPRSSGSHTENSALWVESPPCWAWEILQGVDSESLLIISEMLLVMVLSSLETVPWNGYLGTFDGTLSERQISGTSWSVTLAGLWTPHAGTNWATRHH